MRSVPWQMQPGGQAADKRNVSADKRHASADKWLARKREGAEGNGQVRLGHCQPQARSTDSDNMHVYNAAYVFAPTRLVPTRSWEPSDPSSSPTPKPSLETRCLVRIRAVSTRRRGDLERPPLRASGRLLSVRRPTTLRPAWGVWFWNPPMFEGVGRETSCMA